MMPEEEIDERILRAMSDFGRQGVEYVRQQLNVPYPPASTPGTSPHRRTGNLRDGFIVLELAQNGPETSLTFAALAFYAVYLQDGTKRMKPRPFASLALPELEAMAREILQSEFNA